MPIITSIEQQQRDPERVNVYLDGRFAFGASKMLAVARNLAEGRELSEEEIGDLQHDDAVERAYAAALNFLSYRPRSQREIEDYFRRKKTDSAIAGAVLDRLARSGLVDDHEFARYWVENRQAFRPRGTRALRVEMRQKGLASDVIDGALEGVSDETMAYEAGAKKLRAFGSLDEPEFFRKMVGFLQRRGFPYDVAAETTRKLAMSRPPLEAGDQGSTSEDEQDED